MCLRIVEQYAVCRCVYYVHGVDQCNSYGMRGHNIQDKVVLVGHTCRDHSYSMASSQSSSVQNSPSGYSGAPSPQFIGQGGIGAQIRQQQAHYEQQRQTGAYLHPQQQQYYAQYNGYSR